MALARSTTTDDAFAAAGRIEEPWRGGARGRGGRSSHQLVEEQMERYREDGLKRFVLEKRFPVVSGELGPPASFGCTVHLVPH